MNTRHPENCKINNTREYDAVMKRIDVLMKKGEDKLTQEELDEIRNMALSAQSYEKCNYIIPSQIP